MDTWDYQRSSELYGVREWGAGYFDVGENGSIRVCPDPESNLKIDLYELASVLRRRGIELPIVFRFDGIIASRIRHINKAFEAAIAEYDYQNRYRLAFPIKVNQQRHVVDAVRSAGRPYGIALEVGSKPELIAVLATHDEAQGPILCNGYKDAEYLELALLARKVGLRSIIIIEQYYELEGVLEAAGRLGVEPEIGFRMKPSSRSAGRWGESSGEGAKFGLSANQIVRGVKLLKEHNKSDWLRLLHMHVGSQVSSILAIKRVLREATRVYIELSRLCPNLSMLDVGGGLAVDYDGTSSNCDSSADYSVEEYARDVVWAIYSMCAEEEVPVPEIISESGRAITAHHAVLVAPVTDVTLGRPPAMLLDESQGQHRVLEELAATYAEISANNRRENLHDILALREEMLNSFLLGEVTLEQRAQAEDTIRAALVKLRDFPEDKRRNPDELAVIDNALRDTYFCSFSLFQSLPDSWAIDQLFPIVPIHRHDEEPTRAGLIADLTCDSDGKIDRFAGRHEICSALPLHTFSDDEPYYLGVFLVGAYQETLGDLHNLFGDTNAVHVDVVEDGRVEIRQIVEGDTVREVLSYVQYDPQELQERFRSVLETALTKELIIPEDAAELTKRFRNSLDGYTYFIK